MTTELTLELVSAPTNEIGALIAALDDELGALYSPEQRHGLSLDAIFRPSLRFFLARRATAAVGCGGIALLDGYAEVKRMFVRPAERGQGVARAILARLEAQAAAAGQPLMRLESGLQQPAALRLYERAGYRRCAAFGSYRDLPPDHIVTSVFMDKPLPATAPPRC